MPQHPLVKALRSQLALPVMSAPMFIVSGPELVIAQCSSGIIGAMPALNARPQTDLAKWLEQIESALAELRTREPGRPIAPYAVNHIIHESNGRLQEDLAVCEEYKVPLVITSLRAPNDIVGRIHAWGGKVFHDVTTLRHARKAIDAGVDGLILVCAGAGGHAGTLSPFALLGEVRRIYDGPVVLSGAISRGQDILAALAMGADFAYIGTRFIASAEARAQEAYKQMLVEAQASDIVYTPYFTGIPGSYLRPSIMKAGLDPDSLVRSSDEPIGLSSTQSKPWKDIWSAGQGVGSIAAVEPLSHIVDTLKAEYREARAALANDFDAP